MTPGVSRSRPSDKLDTFGCPLGSLDDSSHLLGGGIKFYRKSSVASPPGQVATPATNRGFLIGLSMHGGHRRRIFRNHHSTVHDFEENSVYVRDFADPYKAELSGRFNFILMEISNASLTQIADGAEVSNVTGLRNTVAEPDPVLAGLARALFSTIDSPLGTSALFVDQISVAMGMHLLHKYAEGKSDAGATRRTLSRRGEAVAKDIIRSRLNGDISIDDMALECGLSRGTFIRAFRQTTGKTPHQWLTRQRIEKAQDLLLTSTMSLAEISFVCGFADQSHFTRVFASLTGATPGIWRRSRQS